MITYGRRWQINDKAERVIEKCKRKKFSLTFVTEHSHHLSQQEPHVQQVCVRINKKMRIQIQQWLPTETGVSICRQLTGRQTLCLLLIPVSTPLWRGGASRRARYFSVWRLTVKGQRNDAFTDCGKWWNSALPIYPAMSTYRHQMHLSSCMNERNN